MGIKEIAKREQSYQNSTLSASWVRSVSWWGAGKWKVGNSGIGMYEIMSLPKVCHLSSPPQTFPCPYMHAHVHTQPGGSRAPLITFGSGRIDVAFHAEYWFQLYRQNNKNKENRENRKRRVRVGGRGLSDIWCFQDAMNSNKNFFCIMIFNLKQKSQNKCNF